MIALEGKTVVVTGASGGIGAASAKALAGAGADLVIHFNANRESAEKLAAGLGRGRTHLVQADLGQAGGAAALWAGARDWKGRIDVLVNNAGIFEPAPVDGGDGDWAAVWEKTMRVNLGAVGDLCRSAVTAFKAQRGGIIINVASRAGFRGDGPDYWAYAASKGGVLALTRTIARNWAGDGVLAYAVAPGFVETEMAARALTSPEKRAAAVADIPIGALAPAEDVANVIAFLASGLAPHATGTTIDVNGASYVR